MFRGVGDIGGGVVEEKGQGEKSVNNTRIKDEAYGRIDKRQKGSVRGMSCRHAVFQLLRDMEQAVREEECAIYTFIDFRKACDSLDWKRMHDILRRMGMPEELGRIVEAVYGGATYALRLGQDRTTAAAKQKSGIRQGSSLSPLLFILCLDFAMRNFCRTMVEGREWTHEEALHFALTWLGYVDDLVTKAESEGEAAFALRELSAACRFIGLELNTKKTEAMTFGLVPEIRNNEDATMELYHDEEGNRGWMVDYDGIDNREEWKGGARAAQRKWKDDFGRPTHWLVWDAGGVSCCKYSSRGWAQVETGEKFRITRLGKRQFVLASKNKFVRQRCGDILADEKALRHHLRQLRVGRYVEAKQKADARKRLVVPVALTVGDEEVKTVGAFRLPGGLKAMLYSALVSSVALYNAETWTIAAADWKVLRRFQLCSLRTMAGEKQWWREQHGTAELRDDEEEEDEAAEHSSRMELCKALGIPDRSDGVPQIISSCATLKHINLARGPVLGFALALTLRRDAFGFSYPGASARNSFSSVLPVASSS
eukprot:g9751.t1